MPAAERHPAILAHPRRAAGRPTPRPGRVVQGVNRTRKVVGHSFPVRRNSSVARHRRDAVEHVRAGAAGRVEQPGGVDDGRDVPVRRVDAHDPVGLPHVRPHLPADALQLVELGHGACRRASR